MKRSTLLFSLSILLSCLLPVFADPTPSPLDLGAWNLQTLQGATATLSATKDTPDGAPGIVVETQTGGSGALWLVQMGYPMSMSAGKHYHLKFIAKSDPDHYVYLGVTQLHSPYASLCEGKSLALTSTWQEIDYAFTPKADESETRILITNLNAAGTKFYIAKMTLATE